MGAKYTTNTSSGFDSSPPADDGSAVAANLVKWSTIKTKLASPVKTLADAINTSLVSAFDYSVRQITASDSTVAGDHMRCVEIASSVSSAVVVSLGDAATMTTCYRVFIKNSSNQDQTIGRVTGGDTIDGTAGNITIPTKCGIILQTNAAANGYFVNAAFNYFGSGLTLTSLTLVTPALGTPASGTLTNCTGLPLNAGVTGFASAGDMYNVGISATVGSSALTVSLIDALNAGLSAGAPATIVFPSVTSGVLTSVKVTATSTKSVVVSSGSTLGTVSGQASRLWVAAINNAGTIEIAVMNSLSGINITPIIDGTLISTTAEGGAGAADSAGVWYSTTARSNVNFVILGYVESTQATAGTWATTPSLVVVNPKHRPGDIIQSRITATAVVDSTATATPNDDTTPQYAEGKAFMSVSVTPTFAGNLFRVDALAQHAISTSATIIGFITKGATGGALAANMAYTPASGNASTGFAVSYTGVTAGVAATSFEYVAGPESGTLSFNGISAAQKMGGVMTSRLRVDEIFA